MIIFHFHQKLLHSELSQTNGIWKIFPGFLKGIMLMSLLVNKTWKCKLIHLLNVWITYRWLFWDGTDLDAELEKSFQRILGRQRVQVAVYSCANQHISSAHSQILTHTWVSVLQLRVAQNQQDSFVCFISFISLTAGLKTRRLYFKSSQSSQSFTRTEPKESKTTWTPNQVKRELVLLDTFAMIQFLVHLLDDIFVSKSWCQGISHKGNNNYSKNIPTHNNVNTEVLGLKPQPTA